MKSNLMKVGVVGAVLLAFAFYFKGTFNKLPMAALAAAPAKTDTYSVPPTIISGATAPVEIGDIVVLNAVQPDKYPADLVQIHYDWKVHDPNQPKKSFVESNNGSQIAFGTGNVSGSISVYLNASYLFAQSANGSYTNPVVLSSGIVKYDVSVIGANPSPIPPAPIPQPVVIPDGQFKLGQTSHDAVATSKSMNKAQIALKLANSYNEVATGIDNKTYTTLGDAYAALHKSNSDVLNTNNEKIVDWNDFDTSVRKAVYQLYLDKKLVNLSDYSTAWKELAVGLKAYATENGVK